MSAEVKSTFHKINVHAAMSPSEVKSHLEPIFRQAKDLERAATSKETPLVIVRTVTSVPPYKIFFLQVFLDEINTSSCSGVFKELVVDRSLGGEVYCIAICVF